MEKRNDSEVLHLRVPAGTSKKLKALAAKRGALSPTEIIRAALARELAGAEK